MDAAKKLQELNELQGRLEGALAYEEGTAGIPSQPEVERVESEPKESSEVAEWIVGEGFASLRWPSLFTFYIGLWALVSLLWTWLIGSGAWLPLLFLWAFVSGTLTIANLLGRQSHLPGGWH